MQIRVPGWLLGLVSLAVPQAVLGCLWDRDTLAAEARGSLEAVQTAVGSFERLPPRYYQMRAERAVREIEAPNAAASVYDDLAVALDRLGRQTEAIGWMERKEAVVRRIVGRRERDEQEYRRRANLGTFYAHRWIRAADRRAAEPDLREGIRWIQAALELNPNAHFGRERYQLMALRWYLDGLQPVLVDRSRPGFLSVNAVLPFVVPRNEVEGEAALAGLSGIVQLGGSWENIDVFDALEFAARAAGRASLALLFKLRRAEIAAAGGRTANLRALELEKPEYREIGQVLPPGVGRFGQPRPEMRARIEAYFREARARVEANQAERQSFLEQQFELGWHPDTHRDFWLSEPLLRPLPPLPDRTWDETVWYYLSEGGALLVGGVLILLTAMGLRLGIRLRRARGESGQLTVRERRFALYAIAFALAVMIVGYGAFFLGSVA